MSTLTRGRRLFAGLVAAALVAGCKRIHSAPFVAGGDAERGKVAIGRYGCGACHTIPGIRGARGLVGPPLEDLARRVYVAGVLQNEPENLVRWIADPPAVDPQTAMPNLGVTDSDARDIAEFLYRLKARN
jgi:cytochrome c1